MTDISKNLVKGSQELAKNSQKYANDLINKSSGLADTLANSGTTTLKEGQNILNNTIKNSKNLGSKIAKRSKKLAKSLKKGDINKSIKNTGHLIKDTLDGVKESFDNGLENILSNKTFLLVLKILIAVYAAFLSHNISKGFAFFLDNLIMKVVMALIIVLVANKDASLAILIALAYILSLQTANRYRTIDESNNIDPPFPNENFESDTFSQSSGNISTNDHPIEKIKPSNSYDLPEVNNFENKSKGEDETIVELEQPLDLDLNKEQPEPNSEWEHSFTKNCEKLQIKDSSQGKVPGANQASCVKTHKNQSCIQGDVYAPLPYSNETTYSKI